MQRRRLLRFGTWLAALSSASALTAASAESARAETSTSPTIYLPITEKGSPSGVASLDMNAKLLTTQLPDLSSTIAAGVAKGVAGADHRSTAALRRLAPVIAAHRTADAGLPENTTEAMAHLPEWVEIVEIDTRRTSDGQTVLMHDATVDRTTNGTGAVADKTLAELKGFKVNGGGSIPTLKEALDAASDCDFNEVLVDIPGDMAHNVPHITAVAAIVAAHAMCDRCIIMVRSTAQMAEFRAVNSILRLGGFGVTKENAFERIEGAIANGAEILLIDPGNYAANREAISYIQAAGLRAGSSTNNDPTTLVQAKNDGAEVVLTDVPGLLRHYAGFPRQYKPALRFNEIDGLIAWFDASAITAPEGAALSTWNDLSGNGYHLGQMDKSKQPLFIHDNGKPAVKFDGVDDFMSTGPFAAPIAQPNTIILVARLWKVDTTTAMDRVLFDGLATGRHVLAFSVSGTNGLNQSWKIFSGGTAQGTTNRSPLSAHVHLVEFNFESSRLLTDGEAIAATGVSPGSHSLTGGALGNRVSDALRPSHLMVYEYAVIDRLLTAAEWTSLKKGLSRSHNIQML